jgi:hypothetical protein
MTSKYLLICSILFLITYVQAYNVTITPSNYDWKYTGGEKILSFNVCHDSKNQNLSIPLITEVTADSLSDLAKIRIQSPYKVETSKCKSAQVKITSEAGYNATRIVLKMYTFNDKTYVKPNDSVNNINIVANQTGLTIKNISAINESTNSTAASTVKPKPNRTLQAIILGIIIIIIIGVIYYYYQQQQDSSE